MKFELDRRTKSNSTELFLKLIDTNEIIPLVFSPNEWLLSADPNEIDQMRAVYNKAVEILNTYLSKDDSKFALYDRFSYDYLGRTQFSTSNLIDIVTSFLKGRGIYNPIDNSQIPTLLCSTDILSQRKKQCAYDLKVTLFEFFLELMFEYDNKKAALVNNNKLFIPLYGAGYSRVLHEASRSIYRFNEIFKRSEDFSIVQPGCFDALYQLAIINFNIYQDIPSEYLDSIDLRFSEIHEELKDNGINTAMTPPINKVAYKITHTKTHVRVVICPHEQIHYQSDRPSSVTELLDKSLYTQDELEMRLNYLNSYDLEPLLRDFTIRNSEDFFQLRYNLFKTFSGLGFIIKENEFRAIWKDKITLVDKRMIVYQMITQCNKSVIDTELTVFKELLEGDDLNGEKYDKCVAIFLNDLK
ncbi:MAG: hypothetical protein GY804_09140 [Alphaproteobacteria bacterium]|nr:hypothetical protein [Alphaproteobacteria bacterium]